MTVPALEVKGLEKRFGGIAATKNLSLSITSGELHALIGPNGAGKTTLVSQLSGELRPSAGRILHHGRDVTDLAFHERCRDGIARSYQITSLFREYTAFENVLVAVQSRKGLPRNCWRDAWKESSSTDEAESLLVKTGLTDFHDVSAGMLSHGAQRQLELGMVLATGADVLLLDEPLAGMGSAESMTMVALLKKLKGEHTIVLIEHDMEAVFSLADNISVLVYGTIIATDTPTAIQGNPDVKAAYLGEADV